MDKRDIVLMRDLLYAPEDMDDDEILSIVHGSFWYDNFRLYLAMRDLIQGARSAIQGTVAWLRYWLVIVSPSTGKPYPKPGEEKRK